jgi:glutamate 5-kinase
LSFLKSNRYDALRRTDDEPTPENDVVTSICAVNDGGARMTRESAMKFNVAGVKKPLASAAAIVAAGNRIMMGPTAEENYIENVGTGEKMQIRIEGGTYVFSVMYPDGEEGEITLDSGAGVNVWPNGLQMKVPLMPKKNGLRMTAANGTPIENLGTKVIRFRGIEAGFMRRA